MEISRLDLSAYRCPMVLLLAKKACINLGGGERLQLLVTDSASVNDICRYLNQNGFTFKKKIQGESTVLDVQNL